jgi:hypothetical protein
MFPLFATYSRRNTHGRVTRFEEINGPPAFYQHAFLEPGRLDRRAPPGGPEAINEKVKNATTCAALLEPHRSPGH